MIRYHSRFLLWLSLVLQQCHFTSNIMWNNRVPLSANATQRPSWRAVKCHSLLSLPSIQWQEKKRRCFFSLISYNEKLKEDFLVCMRSTLWFKYEKREKTSLWYQIRKMIGNYRICLKNFQSNVMIGIWTNFNFGTVPFILLTNYFLLCLSPT